MFFSRLGVSCALLALAAAPALAQGTPNWRASPVYGTLNLDGGFTPDPSVREVRAGGTSRSGVNDCPGYLNASAPDLDVRYSGSGTLPLTFSAASATDVSILVHTPDGRWFCDDDGAEAPLNAKLTISSPGSGTYSVWVATYASSSDRPVAYVGVSEIGRETNENDPYSGGSSNSGSSGSNTSRVVDGGGSGANSLGSGGSRVVDGGGRGSTSGSNGGSASGGEMPNWQATPLYGEINLRAGFRPDPYVQNVTAGGSSRNPVSGSGCTGYINLSAPDFELNYTAGSGALPLNFYVKSNEDTSLLIYTADGRWICDDDGGNGLNPLLSLTNPSSGSYQIWVGTYAAANRLSGATLNISELSPRW